MRVKPRFGWIGCLLLGTTSQVARAAETSLELSVETDSPDALCPDLAATRRAVRDRIGQLSLEGDKRWLARYTIGHAPGSGGDYVLLRLTDGTGSARLERRLPLTGESCETVVQAIALVLERYFRELQAPQTEPEPEPEPDAALPPAPPPEPHRAPLASATTTRPALEVAAPSSSTPTTLGAPSLQLAAKAGFVVGPHTGVVGLEAGLWFARWLQASFEPQLLVPQVVETVHDERGAERGTAQLLEVPLRASLGFGYREQRWALRAGPAVRVSLRRATTHGLVVSGEGSPRSGDGSANGWCVALGTSAAVSYWISPTFGLTAGLAVDAELAETQFEVDGAAGSQAVLDSPTTTFQALAGVAFGATR